VFFIIFVNYNNPAYLTLHKKTYTAKYTIFFTVRKKGTKAVTGPVPFQKGTLLYQKGAYCTFFSDSV